MRGINSRSNERRRSLRAMLSAAGNALWRAGKKRVSPGRGDFDAVPETRLSAAEVEEVSIGG